MAEIDDCGHVHGINSVGDVEFELHKGTLVQFIKYRLVAETRGKRHPAPFSQLARQVEMQEALFR
jgi:hypothetical protein